MLAAVGLGVLGASSGSTVAWVGCAAAVLAAAVITVSLYVMAFATLFTLPIGAWALSGSDLAAVRPATWAWIGYIVLFPTIVTYFLNIWALSRVSSNLVAAYIYLQPVLTAAVAPALLEGEGLTGRAVGAGLAILAGLACVIVGERRQQGQVPVGAVVGE